MFWSSDLAVKSQIHSLLEGEDVTLESLLEQEDILLELKLGNERLIDYLTKPENINRLVTLVTTDPTSEDESDKMRFRYANMACEILSCEHSLVNEKLSSDPALVTLLYDKLQSSEPLNPLLASFIYKILLSIPLNVRVSIETQSNREDFVTSLVNNIGISAVMEFIFKSIVGPDEAPDEVLTYFSTIEFYSNQGLVKKLIALFKEDVDLLAQSNAAQLLSDIIRVIRENRRADQGEFRECPLLKEIESTATVSQLLSNMFESRSESCLTNGIQVLQALLEYGRYRANPPLKPIENAATQDENDEIKVFGITKDIMHQAWDSVFGSGSEFFFPDPMYLERLTLPARQVHAAILPRLGDFHSLLLNPPSKKPIRTTIGLIEKPFGSTRIEVVHLIRALLSGNNPTINSKLTTLKTLPVLMDLFFAYPYNNFLHTHVEKCIQCILDNAKSTNPVTSPTSGNGTEGDHEPLTSPSSGTEACEEAKKNISCLVYQLLVEYNLLQKILDAYSESIDKKSISKPSYLGHMINIANHIESTKDVDLVKSCLDQIPAETKEAWTEWVNETLNAVNSKMRQPLIAESSTSNCFSDDAMALSESRLAIQLEYITNQFKSSCDTEDTLEEPNLHDETIRSEDDEETALSS